uniref:Uncharacterized protein n=1 Tax=Anguilla anguilla TaxID=7936 RepID=A0A0E9WYD8_ANGAN
MITSNTCNVLTLLRGKNLLKYLNVCVRLPYLSKRLVGTKTSIHLVLQDRALEPLFYRIYTPIK